MIDAKKFIPFEWGVLENQKFEIEIGIAAMRSFIGNQEEAWKKTREQIDRFIENKRNDMRFSSDEERNDFYEGIEQVEGTALDEMKRLQRYSAYLAIFSFFESRLKVISSKIEREFKFIENNFTDRSYIVKYWNHIKKGLKIETDVSITFWNLVKVVRNDIAHNNGKPFNDEHRKAVNSLGLSLSDYSQDIEVSVEFLSKLLSDMELFFKELLIAIDKRYKELKAI